MSEYSEPSTYCSEAELAGNFGKSSQQSQPRRSDRLKNASMAKKERSPDLFEETELEFSQINCEQTTKIVRNSKGPCPAESKVERMKIVRLRQGKTVKRSLEPSTIKQDMRTPAAAKRKAVSLTQVPAKQQSANPRTKGRQLRKQPHPHPQSKPKQPQLTQPKRARPPKSNPTQAAPFESKQDQLHTSQEPSQYTKPLSQHLSPSKLPLQYPAHFIHQLPPPSPSPEIANELVPSPNLGSLSSCSSSSLSDSIARIYGTKDLNLILKMECPRKYYLLEEHLPALAMMLDVELDRLRSVIEITQNMTHEQLVLWPQTHLHHLSSGDSSTISK